MARTTTEPDETTRATATKLDAALDCLDALQRIALHRTKCTAGSAEHRLLDELETQCREEIKRLAPEPPK